MTSFQLQSVDKEKLGDEDTGRTLNGYAVSARSGKGSVGLDGPQLDDEDANGQMEENEQGQEQELSEKPVDVPPNGGYGWVCVACCATINA